MEENRSLLGMGVDPNGSTQLIETSRWAKLLAILLLIGIGLMVLLLAFFWSQIGQLMAAETQGEESIAAAVGIMAAVVMVIVAVIVGILMSFLIKGANRIRLGIQSKDQILFNSGLASIKNYFVMYGVIAIIGMIFSLLGILQR